MDYLDVMRAFFYLVPVVSIADIIWAFSIHLGYVIDFGLGLYKWSSIHIFIQLSLIFYLSIYYLLTKEDEHEEE